MIFNLPLPSPFTVFAALAGRLFCALGAGLVSFGASFLAVVSFLASAACFLAPPFFLPSAGFLVSAVCFLASEACFLPSAAGSPAFAWPSRALARDAEGLRLRRGAPEVLPS